jgi:hypothetical protein
MATLSRKDIRKAFSVIIQFTVMAAVGGCIAVQFMDLGEKPVFERETWTQRDGFTAISYQALTRSEDEGINTVSQFTSHLEALKREGYTFITGRDIVDFYNNRPLPEKALYLMLEGGRKDSAIFGQKALGDLSGHAAFYTFTDTLRHQASFFVDAGQLRTLSKSQFWEVGSQGYKLIAFPETPGMRESFYLCDYERDGTGARMESDAAMVARLEEFYRLSYEPMASALTEEPRAFVFPPANSFYVMPEAIELANRRLIEEYFDMAFTREGAAFNAAGQDVRDLSRMRVPPDMSAEELIVHLRNAHTERLGYARNGPEEEDEWLTHKSAVLCENMDVIYIPEEKDYPVPAFLQGSHAWEDIDLSVVFHRENSERMLYLRYASKTSFVRVSVSGARLLVQERIPGVGLRTLLERPMPGLDACRVRLLLKGNRLQVFLDGAPLPDGPVPLSRSHRPGRLGLAALSDAGERSLFGNLTASVLSPLWQDRGRLTPRSAAPALVTASIIRLPRAGEEQEESMAQLLQSAGAGEYAVAALAPGNLDFREEALLLSSITPTRARLLWSGVLLEPDGAVSWEDVNLALENVRHSGFSPILRLNLAVAKHLAESGQTMKADKFVLDFAFDDITPEHWQRLANRHNRNTFYYLALDRDATRGVYAPRRP